LLAVVLGLASSAAWGVSDFLGGLTSRRLKLLTVLMVSQGLGLLPLIVIVAARGEPIPGGGDPLWAALGGLAGLIGLASFYRGLAVGAMSVVAPIAGLSAVIPVVVGVAGGERPGALAGLGIVVALVGVAFASREKPEEEEGGVQLATGVGLALMAAVGFGTFFVGLDEGSDQDLWWALLCVRGASFSALVVIAAFLRPPLRLERSDLKPLAAIGLLDVTANGLFAAAANEGLVSLVAVLGSLYPVVTILLARVVLDERVQRLQQAGIVATLAGVAMISAGAA
jgi:drug/metabolite transporter (DMT)-like permease